MNFCTDYCTGLDPIIHSDLTYHYYSIQKDPAFDFENAETEKIARDVFVHVKKDWKAWNRSFQARDSIPIALEPSRPRK